MIEKLKTVVANELKAAIAKYTVGHPKDTVCGDVLEGDITLNKLVLNPEALDLMSGALPFDAVSVSVEKVTVKLPWDQLTSAPTNVEVSGVKVFFASRLVERPQVTPRPSAEPSKGLPSFAIRLINKLVDNLQVQCSSVQLQVLAL